LNVEAAGVAVVGLVVGLVAEAAAVAAEGDVVVAAAVPAAAAAVIVVVNVSAHGPATQSALHGRHEQRDHHACFYQQGRQEVVKQLEIGLGGVRCLVLAHLH
jgi:hypothetical protein